jgi:predicted unusual protein kinase regulating ubiquinone biosynthesis (AarF/ABC1/UbiB family)
MNPTVDRHRYRRLRWFFTGVLLHAIWFELILDRPLLRLFRSPAMPRWRRIAERYRELAVDLGGVLIKLGQFLSTRVDLLPVEITGVLAGLQDEVPPAPFPAIVAGLEADFGRPREDVFSELDPEPLGAASLSQVHAARLPSGERVVVKLLRPGIELLVETDLLAIGRAVGWLKRYRPIARRVDVDALIEEFTRTTLTELDLAAERAHAERFAAQFADDPVVWVPRAYPEACAARTLTLENVSGLKLNDLAGLRAAGVDPRQVAKEIFRLTLEQLFTHAFVHADPHPGNLFLHPVAGSHDGAEEPPRPTDFRIAFVDFGMMAVVPARLRGALREAALALIERDARRLVRAYVAAGTLLPGADLERLEAAHRALFDRFWGVSVGSLHDTAVAAAPELVREFRDVLRDFPFQVQVDMLFVLRAVGIVSGLTTALDPALDPWREVVRFAASLEAPRPGLAETARELLVSGGRLLTLPRRLDDALTRLDDGSLSVRSVLDSASRRQLQQLVSAVDRLAWFALAAGVAISAALLADRLPAGSLSLLAVGAGAAAGLGLLRRWWS